MATQYKGPLMEEYLRNYFIEIGYYVVRGIKYKFKEEENTDIDLWLYNRPSILTRERINVDIKNKKIPQAIERIFWTKGVQEILGFDHCIVATKDNRKSVKEFAVKHDVILLDGAFLTKLSNRLSTARFTDEEFFKIITEGGIGKLSGDWKNRIELSKSRLLMEMDYSGCNETLAECEYFIEQAISLPGRKESACRAMYLVISHFLVTVDYIMKNLAFHENEMKEKELQSGLRFGNIGEVGFRKMIAIAKNLVSEEPQAEKKLFEHYAKIPVSIISEFFTRNDVSKAIFKCAKEFENYAYQREFNNPNLLPVGIRSIISILLDYLGIERRVFFGLFEMPTNSY